MAIRINQVELSGEHWVVDVAVHEGVYRKDHYPVTVVEVPAPPPGFAPDKVRQAVAEFVAHAVRDHMRSGALPPTGMRIRGEGVFAAPLSTDPAVLASDRAGLQ
ncbi:MAG: hypothetical protein K6U14_02315 [Firmicutes bacterium]|nr:hypothetical protein [Alicyclobacillaceae bacterium]MCL6496455.1 hypothetical protein [Bacillota bacterium]